MERAVKAQIIGVYSREFCRYAENAPGGFLVEGMGFRTYREAVRDTGIDVHRWYVVKRVHGLARNAG